MHETDSMPAVVHFLYVTRVRSTYTTRNVLFLGDLLHIATARPNQFKLHLFFSGHPSRVLMEEALPRERFEPRRLLDGDVLGLLGDDINERKKTVCYICGPPLLTDHLVGLLKEQEGISEERVMCEKWW